MKSKLRQLPSLRFDLKLCDDITRELSPFNAGIYALLLCLKSLFALLCHADKTFQYRSAGMVGGISAFIPRKCKSIFPFPVKLRI